MILEMTVYVGHWRTTEVIVQVEVLECGGDGDWKKFHPEPELCDGPMPCVQCKGTGKQLISV